MAVKYELCVRGSEYTNRQTGEIKANWVRIGVMLEGSNGPFILLEPHISLAGLPRGDNDKVLVSCFMPKDRSGFALRSPEPTKHAPVPRGDFDADVPFS